MGTCEEDNGSGFRVLDFVHYGAGIKRFMSQYNGNAIFLETLNWDWLFCHSASNAMDQQQWPA
jgi:hypothetical protein